MHGHEVLRTAIYGYVSEWVSEWKFDLPTVILSNNFTPKSRALINLHKGKIAHSIKSNNKTGIMMLV